MSLTNTHFGAEKLEGLLRDCRRLFFIGIGGVSMYALALLTLAEGVAVSGSDRVESERLELLRRAGAEVFPGHGADRLQGCDAVIYTVAISPENPEYREAQRRGLPLISRADYLGYLMMRFSHRVGVSGMNGKSTTTALLSHILLSSGDPTVMGGAESVEFGDTSCRIGTGREEFVFEACEYQDSFLDFNPTLAVILNVGMDHVDYFHSIEQVRASFRAFAERAVAAGGRALWNLDDPDTAAAMAGLPADRSVTFGTSPEADFRAAGITDAGGFWSFDLLCHGKKLCRVELRQPGGFQVYNALAAASAAYLCGRKPEEIAASVRTFRGIRRRMEYRGRLGGAVVYDDYAHHPTAIEATLRGAKELPYRRVICAYQPHTYSRTAGLFDDFVRSFDLADAVYFAEIYAARETNESGVSSADLARAIGEKAEFCGSVPALARRLPEVVREGDLLLVMGAGDIEDVFRTLPLTDRPGDGK